MLIFSIIALGHFTVCLTPLVCFHYIETIITFTMECQSVHCIATYGCLFPDYSLPLLLHPEQKFVQYETKVVQYEKLQSIISHFISIVF